MSKTLMLSSLLGAVLSLGLASYKTMEIVEASHCRTFPHECGEAIDSIAETYTQPAAEAARRLRED